MAVHIRKWWNIWIYKLALTNSSVHWYYTWTKWEQLKINILGLNLCSRHTRHLQPWHHQKPDQSSIRGLKTGLKSGTSSSQLNWVVLNKEILISRHHILMYLMCLQSDVWICYMHIVKFDSNTVHLTQSMWNWLISICTLIYLVYLQSDMCICHIHSQNWLNWWLNWCEIDAISVKLTQSMWNLLISRCVLMYLVYLQSDVRICHIHSQIWLNWCEIDSIRVQLDSIMS